MIEIQDYIRKLYEQTGVKLKEDDPILIELVAQQIILEEYHLDLSENFDQIDARLIQIFDKYTNKNHLSITLQEEKLINLIKQIKNRNTQQNKDLTKLLNYIIWSQIFIVILDIFKFFYKT